jgi:hypothetical protein
VARCKNLHYYDTSRHSSCPYCDVEADVGKAPPKRLNLHLPGALSGTAGRVRPIPNWGQGLAPKWRETRFSRRLSPALAEFGARALALDPRLTGSWPSFSKSGNQQA